MGEYPDTPLAEIVSYLKLKHCYVRALVTVDICASSDYRRFCMTCVSEGRSHVELSGEYEAMLALTYLRHAKFNCYEHLTHVKGTFLWARK